MRRRRAIKFCTMPPPQRASPAARQGMQRSQPPVNRAPAIGQGAIPRYRVHIPTNLLGDGVEDVGGARGHAPETCYCCTKKFGESSYCIFLKNVPASSTAYDAMGRLRAPGSM